MILGKLYRVNSNPLEEVENAVLGEEYCTESGTTIKLLSDTEVSIVKSSPLVEGELVENLTDTQLKLFWKLRCKDGFIRG